MFLASADEDREDISNRHFKSSLTVYFHCFVNVAQNTRVQLEFDKLIEDVTRAVYEGPSVNGTDPTQGGRVTWSKMKTVRTDQGDNAPLAAAVVAFEFLYVSPGVNP